MIRKIPKLLSPSINQFWVYSPALRGATSPAYNLTVSLKSEQKRINERFGIGAVSVREGRRWATS